MEKKTKPANTRQASRRRNAIKGAVLSTAAQVLTAAVLLWLRGPAGGLASGLLLLAAALNLITIPPLWFALRERLREIEGGEEEDASQY